MFSGIITEQGIIKSIDELSNGKSIMVEISKQFCSQVKKGDSVAVNGVCLTLTRKKSNNLCFDVWQESLLRTTFNELKNNKKVHLELALRYGENIGGHFISGHIDYVGEIRQITTVSHSKQLKIWINCPTEYSPLLPLRGSVAVEGVSLTITDKRTKKFAISLIPETLKQTLLLTLKEKDKVNIETDLIARNKLDANSILSQSLPVDLYPLEKANHTYHSVQLFYQQGLPVIIQDNKSYYFLSSIVQITPPVLQFILSIAKSRCSLACSSFLADKLAIPSAIINSTKQVHRELLPISHQDNDPFNYSAKSLIKTMKIFLRKNAKISSWKSPGYIFAIQTSKEDYNHPPTIFEAAVHLALLVDKEDSSICCEIYNSQGDKPNHEDIVNLSLRYNLPLSNIKEILKIPVTEKHYL